MKETSDDDLSLDDILEVEDPIQREYEKAKQEGEEDGLKKQIDESRKEGTKKGTEVRSLKLDRL